MRRHHSIAATLALITSVVATAAAPAQSPQPGAPLKYSCAQMEAFLKKAKVIGQRDIPVGVTVPIRATLDDGTLRHDAAVQTIDIQANSYETQRGTELNFRDTWMFNVAGYELAKLLELNIVPPYVERPVNGSRASVSWWVNDAMMERDRLQKKITPPDVDKWNQEMHAIRTFRELIGDADFNATNTLITKDWRVWIIDFSRAFRRNKTLQYPDEVTRTDKQLRASLRSLSRDVLRKRLGRWLTSAEIDPLLVRRDLIVKSLDTHLAAKGPDAVLYELPRASEPCGAGLD
jgi:hypothetical protein